MTRALAHRNQFLLKNFRSIIRSSFNRSERMRSIKVLLIASALIGGVAHASDRVRVGKSQGSAWTFLPLDVGVEQGLFARQGIDVEISDLAGDAKLQQAFAAGGIDFGLGSGPGRRFGQGFAGDCGRRFRRPAAQHLRP